MDLPGFVAEGWPGRDYLVEPFFPTCGIGLLFAPAGVGKTWVAQRQAIDLAKGESFLGFTVPKPRRVILIDGEMSEAQLHSRLKAVLNGEPPPDPKHFRALSASTVMRQRGNPLDLSSETERQALMDAIEDLAETERPELLVLDNLSSLYSTLRENDIDVITGQVMSWCIRLRFLGVSVLLVHHAGKQGIGGGPRGSSGFNGPLDWAVGLDPKGDDDDSTPKFDFVFTKQRHAPVPRKKTRITIEPTRQGVTFEWAAADDGDMVKILRACGNWTAESGKPSLSALADATGVTRSTVNRLLKKARARLLLKDYTLTDKGRTYVEFGH